MSDLTESKVREIARDVYQNMIGGRVVGHAERKCRQCGGSMLWSAQQIGDGLCHSCGHQSAAAIAREYSAYCVYQEEEKRILRALVDERGREVTKLNQQFAACRTPWRSGGNPQTGVREGAVVVFIAVFDCLGVTYVGEARFDGCVAHHSTGVVRWENIKWWLYLNELQSTAPQEAE